DLDRDVVPGDHVLGWHVHRDGPEAHLDHLVDERDQEDDPRPLGADEPAEPEDDTPLVLAEHLDRREQEIEDADDARDQRNAQFHGVSRLAAGEGLSRLTAPGSVPARRGWARRSRWFSGSP